MRVALLYAATVFALSMMVALMFARREPEHGCVTIAHAFVAGCW